MNGAPRILSPALAAPAPKYLRAPRPIHFPSSEEIPETKRHLNLRTALYLSLRMALGGSCLICSEQFVYWDPTDPKQNLAPDVCLKRNAPDDEIDTWKVWERSAPELAVEIVSASDRPEGTWEDKLTKYHRMGVNELVRFDEANETAPLRIWDRVEGDLVERELPNPVSAPNRVLNLYWVVATIDDQKWIRLAHDAEGNDLLPTEEEARKAETEARKAAEARLVDLEAELRKLKGL